MGAVRRAGIGAILSPGFVHPGQATTGGLLLAYGSGGALMLFLLGWCGAALITRLRRGQAFGERLRRLAGAMLASVALIASGGDRYLQSAGGLSGRWSSGWPPVCRSRSKRPASSRSPRRSPVARCPLWRGQRMDQQPGVNSGASEGQSGAGGFLDPGVYQLSAYPALRARLGEQIPRGGHGGDWRSYPEYPQERSLPLLRRAVKDWRITYPVVADNEYAIWNAFGNQYWPAHYIFDARGQLRYTAFGEGDYSRRAGDPAAAAGEQSLTRGAGVWRTEPSSPYT